MAVTAVGALAANEGVSARENGIAELPDQDPPIVEVTDEVPSYRPLTGTILEISEAEFAADLTYVFLETEAGKNVYLVISEETYFVNGREMAEGDLVTGYYDENLPVIMIYPPQYAAVVMVVEPLEDNIKVDRFDEELLSSDQELELNITAETEVIGQDGEPFSGELAKKDLVVIYDQSTDSIPALTTPLQVVVLQDDQTAAHPRKGGPAAPYLPDVRSMELVVEDEIIEAPAAYYSQDHTVMVPLRAVAEALGFNVAWSGEKQLAMLDDSFTVTIGADTYVDMSRDEPINLGAVPELVEGRTYVPLQFFREVVPMNHAHVFETQIVIDNREKCWI